jgi:hypothetical protein
MRRDIAVETSALGTPSPSSASRSSPVSAVPLPPQMAMGESPATSESGKRPTTDDLDVDDLAVAFDREAAAGEQYNKKLTARVLRKVDIRCVRAYTETFPVADDPPPRIIPAAFLIYLLCIVSRLFSATLSLLF